MLSRANELEKLNGQLGGMRDKLSAAKQRAEDTQRELQKAQYELEVASAQQRKAEDLVLQYQGRQEHYDILNTTLEQSCEDLQAELDSFAQRTQNDEARCAAVAADVAEKEAKAAELRRRAEESQSGQSDLMEKTNALSQQVSEKKAAQAALAAERDAGERSIADLKRLRLDMVTDRDQRQALMDQFAAANEKAEGEIAAHQARLDGLRRQGEELRTKLTALSEQKLQLEGQRDARNRESRDCNEAVIATTQELSRMEQKLQGNAMEEKTLLDKLWERYELSHSAALEQRVELESVPKATRYTYLSEQRADVEKARGELMGVIEELTRQMTDIFAQQFKLLNESFQETFLELFGGGKAQLELEDEKDILNCGIEIRVQPPGKQLKTITLLSGGEKAFVAIALYFAILKVHPTPFCVMDEIEAALDESNVVRYARYMRRIAGKTQFIVITHRRGTMEEADVLYGVTMQERGVSRILTINMNDMAKELNIK